MAWGNILSRNLGMPLINLGFSGNGRLEPELIDLINEIDAEAIMLDCMPNLIGRSSEEIESLVTEAVKNLQHIERADLGVLPEGIVDYVHPSDLGMMRQATAVERHLRKILDK